MTDVHQLLVAAGGADAITTEALALRRELRRQGNSEIFAVHRDPAVPGVLPLDRYPGGSQALLFHVSIGDAAVDSFVAANRDPLVLRYHNITPPDFFEPYDPSFAALLKRGRGGLAALRDRATGAIAVSEFNARELRDMGFANVAVAPLVMNLDGLAAAEETAADRKRLPTREEGPVILFVGRLAPNKNQHLLMQMFHVLKTYLVHDAHLFLVGGRSALAYEAVLDRYSRELSLPQVVNTDIVSDAELAGLYRRADVFVTLSAHEGFCAPVVEAMRFGVPVVAWGSSAIPETVGDAALLLDTPSPELAAEAVYAVLADPALRAGMAARGHARAALFDPSVTAPGLAQQVMRMAS